MNNKAETLNVTELKLVERALLIRKFEETLLALFSQGKLNGTVHTCVGQEWSGVAIANAIQDRDIVFSNHRGHGHFLARYPQPEKLFAEIMGKASGVSGGIGGSQHLCADGFYSSGIQGGMVPIAAGSALAQKQSTTRAISVVFIGDGTLGEGALYESLNIASKWELPLLIVVENNGYSQSTSSNQTIAGTIEGRARAFGIEFRSFNTWDWRELLRGAKEAASFVRDSCRPLLLEIKTYRLKAHSKGDDNRDPKEVEHFEEKDPLSLLLSSSSKEIQAAQRTIEKQIAAAVEQASAAPLCSFSTKAAFVNESVTWTKLTFEPGRISDLLYEALKDQFRKKQNLLLIGEDIEGPYGGAFKVTRDLSQEYPGRVRNTPLCEGALVGVATGLALSGVPTIVEIMFGDFLTLTFDQLQQHACKFHEMFNARVNVPIIIRTPMGGRRGYGPTHSQSIEKFFFGMPGLDILSLNSRVSPVFVYDCLIDSLDRPTLVIENKVLYTRSLSTANISGFDITFSNEKYPTTKISPATGTASATIVCYGGMLEEAEAAQQLLFDEHEILCEIVCPTTLQPLNIAPIADSVRRTRSLLVVEEGPNVSGFGSEVSARLLELGITPNSFRRLGNNSVIPASLPAELELLANAKDIASAIRGICHG